ncbi:hypothetical protein BC831DRAFT_32444 [Entophlyctis helioformis]|nr:hypothetical protein BC831DRAFT_32444 [Entophlyctis helioformis]
MIALAAATVALLATAVTAQPPPTFNLLKDDRAANRLSSFLPYTLAQRQELLKQADNILISSWVNYESKLINYGSVADPRPILKNLRDNVATISDADLQLNLIDAFIGGVDLHTRFFVTGSQRCFGATTGVFSSSLRATTSPRTPALSCSARRPVLV